MSATGGHQPVVLALLQTLILLPYLKVFLDLVIEAITLAQLLTVMGILEVAEYK